jgi:hypothetical protein
MTGKTEQGKNTDGVKKPEHEDDLENCKGQCGFTPWCRDCKTPETLPKKDNPSPSPPPPREGD